MISVDDKVSCAEIRVNMAEPGEDERPTIIERIENRPKRIRLSSVRLHHAILLGREGVKEDESENDHLQPKIRITPELERARTHLDTDAQRLQSIGNIRSGPVGRRFEDVVVGENPKYESLVECDEDDSVRHRISTAQQWAQRSPYPLMARNLINGERPFKRSRTRA